MKAILKNYRQAPRKTRLVTDAIKGKSVVEAEQQLLFMPKRAALPIAKLLQSAIKNAESLNNSKEDLFVKSIRVDKGITLKRSMPRARGSAFRINKRSSHIVIELAAKGVDTAPKKEAKVKAPKTEAKTAKPKAAAKKKVSKAKA